MLKIEAVCGCGSRATINRKCFRANLKRNGDYLCQICATKKCCAGQEYRQKCSLAAKEKWQDPTFRAKAVEAANKKWEDPGFTQKSSLASKRKWQNPVFQVKMKEAAVKKWQNPEFRGKMWAHVLEKRALRPPPPPKVPYVASGETKQRISVASKKMWEDPKFKENMVNLMRLRREDEQYLERLSKRSKEMWEDEAYKETTIAATKRWANMPGVREMLSERGKKRWQDPEYRLKMAKIFANCPKVSSLQTTFYSILDDLGVKYFREYEDKAADPECLIGPWSFDCVIPRPGKTTLLVEIQGFRHYRRDQERRDKSKATYISDNFPDQYEVKYVWDHEFGCKDKVVNTVRYWLGLAQMEILDFNIDDVTIQSCPAKDYRLLLSKYHYLPNAGRGGLAFGVYLQDKLIAVCVFSSLVRQNIKVGEHDPKKTKELSRLCIHPSYQKKNFASWFISRCLKMLEDVSCVISYSDTTFNHNGAVYKASNFILDGEVPPDYWYVKDDGWVMHKKALYDHAVKMDQTEREYAEQRGYSKVWGLKKLRFIYELLSSDK